jgi:polyhydroxyalkanoate synthesis regulator phasin
METIANLLSRDLSRKIEEIIQVDQTDEQSVYSEITEYIATDSIRDQYAALLKAVAEAPSDPHESVGIWISSFFGSGKSSFAKNLGYALENRRVQGQEFAVLFKQQIHDEQVSNLLDLINTRFPTEAILFDIAKEQDTRRVTQRIAEFIYTCLLRELDYAEDFDIAELEIELESEGKLELFIAKCKQIHGQKYEARDESRQKNHENHLYWIFSLTPEIDELVAQLFASRKMVEKYDQLRAQSKITPDEAICLQDEKNIVLNYESRLRGKITEAIERGTGMFRGVARDASSLGKSLGEIIKNFLEQVVPDFYPKLEMGSCPLHGDEPEIFLKAADLKALPQVFYVGEHGLGLVTKEGSKYVSNPGADVAKEVHDYLASQHEYSNREACLGKALENRFNGMPYGWERDVLRLVLAVLFRAGVIEVSFGGQKFDSFTDPRSREPFINNTKFKSAIFTPVKPIDLKTLTQAVQSYEDLTGKTVDVEKNAIGAAAQQYAGVEAKEVIPIITEAKARYLPVPAILEEYREALANIETGTADDCVTLLAGGAASLKDGRERIRKIADCLNEKGLATLQRARLAANDMSRLFQERGQDEISEKGKELRELLQSGTFFDSMAQIEAKAQEIIAAYRELYETTHAAPV